MSACIVQAGLVKVDNLSQEETIGIMDATLATLVRPVLYYSLYHLLYSNILITRNQFGVDR